MSTQRYSNATNLTEYARIIGYRGARDVFVRDGHVVSHRNQDWFEFCENCREQAASRATETKATGEAQS